MVRCALAKQVSRRTVLLGPDQDGAETKAVKYEIIRFDYRIGAYFLFRLCAVLSTYIRTRDSTGTGAPTATYRRPAAARAYCFAGCWIARS